MANSENEEVNNLIKAQNESFEYLVFSGGGAKGAGYSGVQAALEESGVLKGIKAIAGSSAGAITAAAIATGISKEKYQSITENTNIKSLLGNEGFLIHKDGKPLFEMIANTVRDNISEYLNNTDIMSELNQSLKSLQIEKQQLSKNNIPRDDLDRMNEVLQKRIDRLEGLISTNVLEIKDIQTKCSKGEDIKFKELDLLYAINPVRFKGLIITATDKKSGELILFNAENYPDVTIADAVRASASIPVILRSHRIDGSKYVDGGYRDNIPLNYFGSENKKQNAKDLSDNPLEVKKSFKQGRTLALAFGGDMKADANVAIYSAKEKIVDYGKVKAFLTDVIFKVISKVGGKFKYSKEEEKVHQNLRKNALNTVVLDTGEISTLSFDKAQEKAQYLHTKGYLQTCEYLNNFDVGFIKQPIEHKNFILNVYEENCKQPILKSLQNKITGGLDKKNQAILDLCRNEISENKTSQEMLKDLVITASTQRTDNKLNANTNTMTNLINKLNDPYTSEKVKTDFVQLLKIDMAKDVRADPTKTFSDNLVKFKFNTKDFEDLISKQKSRITNEDKDHIDKHIKPKINLKEHMSDNKKKSEVYPRNEISKSIKKDGINNRFTR